MYIQSPLFSAAPRFHQYLSNRFLCLHSILPSQTQPYSRYDHRTARIISFSQDQRAEVSPVYLALCHLTKMLSFKCCLEPQNSPGRRALSPSQSRGKYRVGKSSHCPQGPRLGGGARLGQTWTQPGLHVLLPRNQRPLEARVMC